MTSESSYTCSGCDGVQCHQRERSWWEVVDVDVTRFNNSSENGKTYWLCFSCQREAWRDKQKEMKFEQIGECVWKNARDWQEQKAEEGKEYKRQCQGRVLASLRRRGTFLGNDSGDTSEAMDTSP